MSTSTHSTRREAAGETTLVSRRVFLAGFLAVGVSAAASAVARPTRAHASRKVRAFAFEHDGSTTIVIDRASEPTRLDVEVRYEGSTVERFENADPHRLHRLRSTYFTVVYFDPPTPP